MKTMKGKIKNIKQFLEKVSDKDIDILSSIDCDISKLTKKQHSIILDVSLFLYGKKTFTEKQLRPFISEAYVWVILEKMRRAGIVKIDNKGIIHKTRLGTQVEKYMTKHNKQP